MGKKGKKGKKSNKVIKNNVKDEDSNSEATQHKSKYKSSDTEATDRNPEKSDHSIIEDKTHQSSYLRRGFNWISFVILLPLYIILKILIWIFNKVLWLLNFIEGVLQLACGSKKVLSKYEELKTKLDESRDTIAILEKEKGDALTLLDDLRDKIAKLETEKEDALTLLDELRDKIAKLETEKGDALTLLKKFKDNVAIITKEKEDGLTRLQKCKNDLQNIESEKKNVLASLEKFKDTTANIEKEKEVALKQLDQIKTNLQNVELEKKNALARLNQHQKDLQTVESKKKDALSRCEKLEHAMAILEKEKDDALTRLSELMGNKLRENNPAITNLNDPNRPMKLGEQFGELYENEWTDAFSEISERKELNLKEFEIIGILLKILKEINKVCRDDVSNHMTENNLNDKADTKHEVSLKAVKETLKSNASSYIPLLCKNITQDGSICTSVLQYKDYSLPYIEQCVKICYLAVLQDPPMYINFEPDKIYDKQAFKEYTKSGSEVNFLVWPALHLHESGPILCKGVVQPKG